MKSKATRTIWPAFIQVVAFAAFVNLLQIMAPSQTHAEPMTEPIRIVAFGDSLTAGYGLPQSAAFPVQLAKVLRARGHQVEIVNAGVSGDTTAAGLERFDWAVAEKTDAVILELGANDALRGLSPRDAHANLDKIIAKLTARGIDVLLAGMSAPRSMGAEYVSEFDRIFPDLAQHHNLLLYPFFLDGVAGRKDLNLDDGIHPTAKGVGIIVERMVPKVEELLARVVAKRSAASKS